MDAAPPKRPKLWITISEIVGILALLIAGLSFWDSHRDRSVSEKQAAQQQQQQRAQQRADQQVHSILVLTGEADGAGDRIRLEPMNHAQAVQSQTLMFPSEVRAAPVEIDAATPRIEKGWVVDGLKKSAEAARKAKKAKPAPEGRLPVGIVTTYIQDGVTRTDRSIYRIGYSTSSNIIGVERVRLEGLSLARRGVSGDLRAQVDALWARR
jgi:hypothetical protein